MLLSQHAGLADIASAMFADPKAPKAGKPKVSIENDVTAGVANYDAALANANALLKFG